MRREVLLREAPHSSLDKLRAPCHLPDSIMRGMALHRFWLRALGLWRLFFKALCQTPSHPDFLYRSLVRDSLKSMASKSLSF